MPVPLYIDDDGCNYFRNLPSADASVSAAADAVADLPQRVTGYMLCAGAGTYYFPTATARVDPRCTALIDAHARGIDPFGDLLRAVASTGRETFITFRMNDVHNPTDSDEWNVPEVRKRHPDCIVDAEAIKAGRADWLSYCLDYSRSEVRTYVLGVIEELLGLYGEQINGFQLDWMRFPRHLSGTADEVWAKRGELTQLVEAVRGMLGEALRRPRLSVRVPAHSEGCRFVGLDIGEWCRRGLVDMVVACPFLTTEFNSPLEGLHAVMGKANGTAVPLIAGHDFQFGTQNHNPESLRGAAASLLDGGADGLYLFNFPCWIEYLAARPYHWLREIPDERGSVVKPILLAVGHRRHRMAHVDPPATLPATIEPGESVHLSLRVPGSALPARRAMWLVHSGGDVALNVNGQTLPRFTLPQGNVVTRSEIFVEFIAQDASAGARPALGDTRLFLHDAAALSGGVCDLIVTNHEAKPLTLNRVNLAIW